MKRIAIIITLTAAAMILSATAARADTPTPTASPSVTTSPTPDPTQGPPELNPTPSCLADPHCQPPEMSGTCTPDTSGYCWDPAMAQYDVVNDPNEPAIPATLPAHHHRPTGTLARTGSATPEQAAIGVGLVLAGITLRRRTRSAR